MDSTNTNTANEYLSPASPSTNFLPDDKQTNKREDKDEYTQISNVVIDSDEDDHDDHDDDDDDEDENYFGAQITLGDIERARCQSQKRGEKQN